MRKYILFCANIFIALNIYPQSLQIFDKTPIKENLQIKNDAPSVSQMSRHDDMSINEYLGIPDISIPLFNMELIDINIPLNISYQATGIKVNQDASSVGIGWDLNTLGSVVQIVRGDDDMNPYRHPYLYRLLPDYYSSHYAHFEYLPETGYDSSFPMETNGYPIESVKEKYGYRMVFRDYFPINGRLVMNNQFRYSTTYWDSEPDVFIINILGEKLHCITSDFSKSITQGAKSSRVTVLNKIGYKVEWIQSTDNWVVTNPQGTRFFFEIKQPLISETYTNTIMYSTSPGSGSDSSKNISQNIWYLTRIETALGTAVYLSYNSSEEVEFITNGNGTIEYMTSLYRDNYDPRPYPTFLLNLFLSKAPITQSTVKSITREKQYILTKISSKKCDIEFSYTNREDIPKYKKLEEITLSYNDEEIKKINFSYNHITNSDIKGKRLFLNSINLNGELYKFTYNTTRLPSRNSFAQDYWGYYNGSSNNNSLVPNPKRFGHTVVENLETYYDPIVNNMSANLKYTKAGILERITYPTSGFVEFEYELNTFNDFWVPNYTNTNNPRSSGSEGFGLRIKSILYKDSDSKLLKKKIYQYYGGKSVNRHVFDKDGSIEWINSTKPNFSQTSGFRVMSTSSLSDVNPFSTHTGVGYDSVSCIFKSIDDNKEYKTTTLYHNTPHISSAHQPITRNLLHTIHMPSFENSSFPKNGSVKEKRYYNDFKHMVRREEYQYENKKSNILYGVKLMKIQDVYYKPLQSGSSYQQGISRYLLGYYPVFDFESLVSKKTETENAGNGILSTEHIYIYDDKRRLQEINATSSDGKHLSKNIIYESFWNSSNIYSLIKEENHFSEENQLVYKKFDYNTQNPTIKQIVDGRTPSSLLNSIQYEYIGIRPKMIVNNQDTIIYLWAFNGLYPVAEIRNATYTTVNTAVSAVGLSSIDALSRNTNPDKSKLDQLREQLLLKNAHITTYKYTPLVGVTEITDPSGKTTYYEYDSFGRLIRTKDMDGNTVQEYDYHYKNQ